ncbi:hypothetical protein GCM10010433_07970 [Streptomyces pulveraceus]
MHDACATWFPGFARNATENEHGFSSLDAGLAVIAEHAKSLGCHGLILFMDQVILRLANHVHDQKFVSHEADKTTSFVKGARPGARSRSCRSSPADVMCAVDLGRIQGQHHAGSHPRLGSRPFAASHRHVCATAGGRNAEGKSIRPPSTQPMTYSLARNRTASIAAVCASTKTRTST